MALEALSNGCPIVALRGCGLDTMISDGIGVLASDSTELAAAMLNASNLRRQSHRIDVPSEFTWPCVGRNILRVYRDISPESFP